MHNTTFEMVPLLHLTLWKRKESSSSMSPTTPNTDPSPETGNFGTTTNEFECFSESFKKEQKKTMENNPRLGDSFVLMWCPWYNMYNSVFVEFWMIRHVGRSCGDMGEDKSMKQLRIKQDSKTSKQMVERHFTGTIWGYSVTSLHNSNCCDNFSTSFVRHEIENLLICFFGASKVFKYKLCVKKTPINKIDYVTGIECMECIASFDYNSLTSMMPTYRQDNISSSLYSISHRSLKDTSMIQGVNRMEMIQNSDGDLLFTKYDSTDNFQIYKIDGQQPNESLKSSLFLIEQQTVEISNNKFLSLLFFQRTNFNEAKNKISFEIIGDVCQGSSGLSYFKFDENKFVVLDTDSKGLDHYFRGMGAEENSDVLQFYRWYLLDLSDVKNVRVSRISTTYDFHQHSVLQEHSNLKLSGSVLKMSHPKASFFPNSPPQDYSVSNLLVTNKLNMLPVYRNQKTKKRQSHVEYEKRISHFLVFKDQPSNPFKYTIAIFYLAKGDRYQFSENLEEDFSSKRLKGKWFDLIHFTHVSFTKTQTLFDSIHTNTAFKTNLRFFDVGIKVIP